MAKKITKLMTEIQEMLKIPKNKEDLERWKKQRCGCDKCQQWRKNQ